MAKVSFVRGTDAQIEQLELTEGQVVVSESGKMYVDTDTDRIPISPKEETITAVYDTTTATSAHAVGSYVYVNNHLYRVTVAIAIGDTITVGTNVVLANDLDTNTPVYVSGLPDSSGGLQAIDVGYDNTESGLNSENVQEAIDELVQGLDSSTVDYVVMDEAMTQLEFAEMLYDEFNTNDDLMELFVVVDNGCYVELKSSVSSLDPELTTFSDQYLVRITRHPSYQGNPLFFDVVAYRNGNKIAEKMKFQIVVSSDTVTDLLVTDYVSRIDYSELSTSSLNTKFKNKADRNLGNIENTTATTNWYKLIYQTSTANYTSDDNLYTADYLNGKYVRVTCGTTYTSIDNGKTWTSVTNNLSGYGVDSVAYMNNKYVAFVNLSGINFQMYYSTDLVTWTQSTYLEHTDEYHLTNGYERDDSDGNGGIYVFNNKFWIASRLCYNDTDYDQNDDRLYKDTMYLSSTDGDNWTIEKDWDDEFVYFPQGSREILVETNRLLGVTRKDNKFAMMVSTNGKDWSLLSYIADASYYPSNPNYIYKDNEGIYYLFLTYNKIIFISSDLENWDSQSIMWDRTHMDNYAEFLGFSNNVMMVIVATSNSPYKAYLLCYYPCANSSNGKYHVSLQSYSDVELDVRQEGHTTFTCYELPYDGIDQTGDIAWKHNINDWFYHRNPQYLYYSLNVTTPVTTDNYISDFALVSPFVSEVDKAIDILGLTGASTANDVSYNNASSGLTADNVQDAIDELANAPAPITNIEAVYEETTALSAHSVDDYICMNNLLYRVTSAISIGDSIVVDTNVELVDDGVEGTEIYISNIPSSSGGGVEADDVGYDNTDSGLTADNVQDAVDEIVEKTKLEEGEIGLQSSTTVFNQDGSITQTFDDGNVKTTTFNQDGSITEELVDSNDTTIYIKTTTFNQNGSISEEVI